MIAVMLSISLMGCSASEIDSSRGKGTYQDVKCVDRIFLYHLADHGTCGCTNDSGDYVHFEGFCGIKAFVDKNNKIKVEAYNHKLDLETTGEVSIFKNNYRGQEIKLLSVDYDKNITTVTLDFPKTIQQMKTKNNKGIYFLQYKSPTFGVARIPLYYNGSGAVSCAWEGSGDAKESCENWGELVKNIDPKKCLDMWVGNKNVPITYPTSGMNGNCNHVKEWCEMSNTILKNNDGTWSDEYKVFAFTTYLTNHYAYDDWRVYTNKNKSRARLAGDKYNEDKYFTYYNHVGQCADFTNIMTIMCRYQGIPATSVENVGHTVVAVYLDGEWVAIDNTMLMKYHCKTEDTSKDKWVIERRGTHKDCYGYYEPDMRDYNQSISTPKVMSSAGSGENPR